MSEKTTDLLPCPFCGGEAYFGWFAITPNINCKTCGFEMDGEPAPDVSLATEAANALRDRWNTRAPRLAAYRDGEQV